VEQSVFDEVSDALRGMVPPALGPFRQRVHRYGIKIWFGSETPPREHYEAQVIGADHVEDANVLAVEVGFHSEYPRTAENDAVLAHLLACEARWRAVVGDEAIAGPFLGRPDDWRRVSETWPDPDLGDVELAVELAARLVDYVTALEPVRKER
jgi:hypothetical protein